MQTLKELTSTSFDSIHEIVVNHLIENYGECDHDKHGEMLSEIISCIIEIKEYQRIGQKNRTCRKRFLMP